MNEPNYIVLRPAPDLPAGFFPPHLDGRWYETTGMTPLGRPHEAGDVVAVPTGRFEVRDYDGAVAEVYEVQQ